MDGLFSRDSLPKGKGRKLRSLEHSAPFEGQARSSLIDVDGQHPAPPAMIQLPNSLINTTKQWCQPWLESGAKWISSIHRRRVLFGERMRVPKGSNLTPGLGNSQPHVVPIRWIHSKASVLKSIGRNQSSVKLVLGLTGTPHQFRWGWLLLFSCPENPFNGLNKETKGLKVPRSCSGYVTPISPGSRTIYQQLPAGLCALRTYKSWQCMPMPQKSN